MSFAVLAVPAFAAERGAPYEQTQADRALPDVSIRERPANVAARPFVDYNFIAPAL